MVKSTINSINDQTNEKCQARCKNMVCKTRHPLTRALTHPHMHACTHARTHTHSLSPSPSLSLSLSLSLSHSHTHIHTHSHPPHTHKISTGMSFFACFSPLSFQCWVTKERKEKDDKKVHCVFKKSVPSWEKETKNYKPLKLLGVAGGNESWGMG